MTPKEALRDICQSSHCVSETLRKVLKPFEVTERKNIINTSLSHLEELEKKETPMKPIHQTHTDGASFGYCPHCADLTGEDFTTELRCDMSYCYECGHKLDWSDEK